VNGESGKQHGLRIIQNTNTSCSQNRWYV